MLSSDVKAHVDCDNCGAWTESHIISDTLPICGQMVTVDKVPVEICPNCGNRYYDGPFILELERAMAEKVAA